MHRISFHKLFLLLFTGTLFFGSCTAKYGKKTTFEGTKGEVFYKGGGVTESDAKATGEFLKKENFFMADDKVRSVQISKTGDRIQARFVIDEKGLAEVKNADQLFEMIGAKMSKEVFKGLPVDIVYSDKTFADKKILTYNPSVLETESSKLAGEIKQMKRKDFNNNTVYYTANIGEGDISTFFNYLKESGFFTEDGSADLMVNQATDRSVRIRFPVKNEFNNEEGLSKVEAFAGLLKKEIFNNTSFKFEVLDEDMKAVKIFTYQ